MSNEYMIDDSTFLAQVPVALIEENILTQFNNPFNFRRDYVNEFISSYKYSLEFIENDDEMEELKARHDEFIDFMSEVLSTKLGLGINGLKEMSFEEQEDLIHFTYRFFIINMKNNFFNLFLNYISENKEALIESATRKKDVTSQAFRREITEEDATILANLSDIMNNIMNDEKLLVDDFLRLCTGDTPSTELTLVNEYFDDFILTGNFIPYYVRMMRIPMRIQIEGNIRNVILKKYREENPIMTEDENEN